MAHERLGEILAYEYERQKRVGGTYLVPYMAITYLMYLYSA